MYIGGHIIGICKMARRLVQNNLRVLPVSIWLILRKKLKKSCIWSTIGNKRVHVMHGITSERGRL